MPWETIVTRLGGHDSCMETWTITGSIQVKASYGVPSQSELPLERAQTPRKQVPSLKLRGDSPSLGCDPRGPRSGGLARPYQLVSEVGGHASVGDR